MKATGKPTATEAQVLRACLAYLKAMKILAWRQNTGSATYQTGGVPAYGGQVMRARRVAFGLPGSADITGILPDGRRLEVECKRPGRKLEHHQDRFRAMIERNNGVFILAHSVEELREKLNEHVI